MDIKELKIGSWVQCFNIDSPGRIRRINTEKNMLTVDFLTEWHNQEDTGGTEEIEISPGEIEKILTDPHEIAELEKELEGKIKFEKGFDNLKLR